MGRLRPALKALAALALLWAAPAQAQPCHEPAPLERRSIGLRAGVGAEYATYRTSRYEGDYQGVSASLQWEGTWARLRAVMPAYRIERNGLESEGPGDLLLDARAPLVRADSDAFAGGIVLATMLPTGDADHDLGMGHLMLMPGLWASWTPPQAFVTAQLNYGRALEEGDGRGGHHHHGPRPIVNPMNLSELEAAASAGYLVHEVVRARAGAYGALPAGATDGAARAAAFVGVDLLVDRFDLGLEGHLPLVGDPFSAKVAVTLGARF